MDVIIGLDESGNGAIAGPLAVTAIAFLVTTPAPVVTIVRPRSTVTATPCDSKKVKNAEERLLLAKHCCTAALSYATEVVESAEVDQVLTAGALRKAAGAALHNCVVEAERLTPGARITILVDGSLDLHFKPRPNCHIEYVVGGDASRWQISAASLVARSEVDRHMRELDRIYPAYGFGQHSGYATPNHLSQLRALGPCPAHRRTFKSVMQVVGIPTALTELG